MKDNLTTAHHEALASAWGENITKALSHRKRFRDQYNDAARFAYESHDFVFKDDDSFKFKTTVPKSWEALTILTPMLAFREPSRTVRVRFARDQEDPRHAFAKVAQDLLNYQAHELGLKDEAREWVEESILAAGVMWLERDPLTGLVGHFNASILDLLIDPDAETLRDAWWVARRKLKPRWEVAHDFNISVNDPDLPRGEYQTITAMELVSDERARLPDGKRLEDQTGQTNELVEVWEFWSKMGIGFRCKGVSPDVANSAVSKDKKTEMGYGDNVHFYWVKGSRRLFNIGGWPIPLHEDGEWPCTLLYYHKQRRYVWPVSVLAPSLGLQKAIDWMATMILNKIRTTTRDFIATLSTLDENIRQRIKSGGDLEVLTVNESDIAEGKSVADLIAFLQHPPMNADVWRVWELIMDLFEKASGLYAALYGKTDRTQPRSAAEVHAREERADLRPEDMRRIVEERHAILARKEMIAMRLLYEPGFVGEILGPDAAQIWGEYKAGDVVLSTDPATGTPMAGRPRIVREYDFRVEAASTTKPDVNKEREQAQDNFDRLVQVALNLADINAVNNLSIQLQEAMGITEDRRITFQPPPPPEQDPTVQAKMQQEEAKVRLAEMKVETEAMKAGLDLEAKQMKMHGDQQKQEMDIASKALDVDAQARMGEPSGEPGDGEVVEVSGGKAVRA